MQPAVTPEVAQAIRTLPSSRQRTAAIFPSSTWRPRWPSVRRWHTLRSWFAPTFVQRLVNLACGMQVTIVADRSVRVAEVWGRAQAPGASEKSACGHTGAPSAAPALGWRTEPRTCESEARYQRQFALGRGPRRADFARWGGGGGAPAPVRKAPVAIPSRGHVNPRRGISVSSRWGWGPGASEKFDIVSREASCPPFRPAREASGLRRFSG
jgi:hypothetical protein